MRTGALICGTIALAIVVEPASASACSFSKGVDFVTPDRDNHPANAAIVLVGSQLDPDGLTATIDDVPAMLVVDEGLSTPMALTTGWHILTLQLEPQPRPGQSVRILGDVCDGNCQIQPAWTAVAVDTQLVAPELEMSFDLGRYVDAHVTSCGASGSIVHVELPLGEAPFPDEESVLLEVTATNRDAGLALERRWDSRWAGDGVNLEFDETIVGDAFPRDGWCVEVAAIDPAGNRVAIGSSCEACGFGESPSDVFPSDFVFEPIPGGPCDLTGDTTGTSGTSAADTSGSTTDTTAAGTTVAEDPTSAGDTTSANPPADGDVPASRGCTCDAGDTTRDTGVLACGAALLLLRLRKRRS